MVAMYFNRVPKLQRSNSTPAAAARVVPWHPDTVAMSDRDLVKQGSEQSAEDFDGAVFDLLRSNGDLGTVAGRRLARTLLAL